MSNIGKYRHERMESDDYRFGWESAQRGEPYPMWKVETDKQLERIENQRMGWTDFRNADQCP